MKKILILFIILFFITSCNNTKKDKQESDTKKISVIDTRGNKVELKNPAQRVVCLFDPSVDVIYMLQKQETLVGIPAELYFDKELYGYFRVMDKRIEKKELATPGSNDMTNIESLISENPDLVIAQQLTPSTISTLNNMGIAVYLSSSDTYENLNKEMRDIALMLGNEKRGEELINYTKQETEKLQKRANEYAHKEKKTAYFSWANGRIFTTTGRESMMNNCLELAGVQNVCPTNIDKMNINPETLIKWNPDMIVMWNDSPELFYKKPELSTVRAVANKQIYNLMPMFFYSPHTFKALCAATAINNWAYVKNEEKTKKEIGAIILKLYGEEVGKKLNKHL